MHSVALKEPRGKVNSQSVQMMLAKGVQAKECSMGWKKHADLLVGRWLWKGSWKGEQFSRVFRKEHSPDRRREEGLGYVAQVMDLSGYLRAMFFLIFRVQKCYVRR